MKRISLSPAVTGTFAVLGLLPRVSRPMTVVLALGVALMTALPLGFTIVTGFLIGAVPPAVRQGLDSGAGHHALTLLALATLLIVAQRIGGPFLQALATVFGRHVDRHLQERVIVAVNRPGGIGHLEDPAVLDLIKGAQGIGTQGYRPGDAVASLASLLPSWLTATGSIVILATFRWWLGLIWLIMWPIVLYYLQREYVRVSAVAQGEAGAVRRADYFRDLALQPATAKELRVWGLPTWLIERFESHWLAAMGPIWRARQPGRAVLWTTTVVVAAANFGAFGLLAWSAVHGDLTLTALAIYTQAVVGASSFRAFDDQNMMLAYATVAVPSLLTLERRLEGDGAPEPGRKGHRLVAGQQRGRPAPERPLPAGSPETRVDFKGVSFRYPNQDADTLVDVSLALPAGRSLAIVGANGAGKTTLVKLLCRLYEPTGGRITVDGLDLEEIDAADWRRHVAAIFQDFSRYHLSVRENIALGALGLSEDTARLEQAARTAGALDIIQSLPRGWDTVLSRQYEGGVDLSGGQWQRVALARALFAVEGGARVLILDEPTANLDVRAEAEIYDRFLEITAGLTTVLISHRFSTVRRADHIVVLEGGRITEQGTHDALLARDGQYAHMFRLQAERFVEALVGEEA